MTDTLPADHLTKIDQAIADFKNKRSSDDLQAGTPEWEAAVNDAIESYQLELYRKAFEDKLRAELPRKFDLCIRDKAAEKCNEGPWFGATCTLCGKKGTKPERPDRNQPATRS